MTTKIQKNNTYAKEECLQTTKTHLEHMQNVRHIPYAQQCSKMFYPRKKKKILIVIMMKNNKKMMMIMMMMVAMMQRQCNKKPKATGFHTTHLVLKSFLTLVAILPLSSCCAV